MNGFEAMLWFGYPAFVADGGAAAFEKGRTHVRFDGGWREDWPRHGSPRPKMPKTFSWTAVHRVWVNPRVNPGPATRSLPKVVEECATRGKIIKNNVLES